MGYLDGITPRFGNYNPASFGWAAGRKPIPYSWRGIPIIGGVANADIATIATAILDDIATAGKTVDPDPDEWGYNYRPLTGGGNLSFHAYGLAVDIDASENPYVRDGSWRRHTIPDVAAGIARKYGWEWGGDWRTPKDYMHFECHLSPMDATTVAARIRTNSATRKDDDMAFLDEVFTRAGLPADDPLAGKEVRVYDVFAWSDANIRGITNRLDRLSDQVTKLATALDQLDRDQAAGKDGAA